MSNLRRYETIFISNPDLSDDQRSQLFERVHDIISGHNGHIVKFDKWGVKKLAYEIKTKVRGFYVLMDYCGTGQLIDELERSFRIDDRILKFMTILLDKEADIEKLAEEADQADTAKVPDAPKVKPAKAEKAVQTGDKKAEVAEKRKTVSVKAEDKQETTN